MEIEVQEINRVKEKIEELKEKGENLRPLYGEIGNYLYNVIDEAFENEKAPFGSPWHPLKASTLKRKKNKKILQESGKLIDSLYYRVENDGVIIGVNATKRGFPYPIVHQFGTNRAGKKRNITILPRPFFPIDKEYKLNEEVLKNILSLIDKYINTL